MDWDRLTSTDEWKALEERIRSNLSEQIESLVDADPSQWVEVAHAQGNIQALRWLLGLPQLLADEEAKETERGVDPAPVKSR